MAFSDLQKEALLQAWIDMSLRIRGNRLVSGLSFNEIVICRILYERQQQNAVPVTATELCQRMQLLKSQVNKLLTTMERKGLIERVRSETDRRKIEVRLYPGADQVYLTAHEGILKIMAYVCAKLGEESSEQLTRLLHEAVLAIDEMPTFE